MAAGDFLEVYTEPGITNLRYVVPAYETTLSHSCWNVFGLPVNTTLYTHGFAHGFCFLKFVCESD